MAFSDTSGLPQRLDDRLVLRTVEDADDARRFAEFNHTYNGAEQGATCAALLRGLPAGRGASFWLVEDLPTGQIVSTTCLIPWHWQLGGVALRVAQLEMVLTHPDYRKRGLVRAQIAHFHRATADYDLCVIEGIPYYYRQFGYAYALDHRPTGTLSAGNIPYAEGAPLVQWTAAQVGDIPRLADLHNRVAPAHLLWVARNRDEWRYLLEDAAYPLYLLWAREQNVGYMAAWRSGDGENSLSIAESAIPDATHALALLQDLRPLCRELWIDRAPESTLWQVAQSLGARADTFYQWLVRIPDLARLLQKFAPLFAERLHRSSYVEYTGSLLLNLYHQAYRLDFAAGELVAVDAVGFVDASMYADPGDLAIPPDAFTRLLLGYRTLDALKDAWPDIYVRTQRRHLLECLFPQADAQLWMPYMHCGHLARL